MRWKKKKVVGRRTFSWQASAEVAHICVRAGTVTSRDD